ncbi:MAG: glycoside hydrolase family 57 protein [Patescibacteria group bacterium]
MPKVSLYFELHQPYRLAPYSIFEVGRNHEYFSTKSHDSNREVFTKVALKSYIPMLSLLLNLTKQYKEFVWAFSCSGIFLEQAETYVPEVLDLLQELLRTRQVEVLAETYYHSLASLYSSQEFFQQVDLHSKKIVEFFGVKPTVFRNTELIYSDAIASLVGEMGYTGILTEAVDRYLEGQKRTQLFSSYSAKRLPLMLKHSQLSDDIAFRFSDKSWVSYPLKAETYVHWLNEYQQNEIVNLFMDFETFGEHQWGETGIFDFFQHVVHQFIQYEWNQFVTPSQAMQLTDARKLPLYKVAEPISWADIDRDLSAWRDNELQHDTLRLIYELESQVKATNDKQLLHDWRKLQTSDHFYYMCVKWSADGDVHAYFSPYENPMDAYVRFTTVLADIQSRISQYQAKPSRVRSMKSLKKRAPEFIQY